MTEIKERKRRQSLPLTVLGVIFFVYSLTLIFPLLWLLYNSVKGKVEFFMNPWHVPEKPFAYLANYGVVFREFDVARMLFNSVFLSLLGPVITLFCTACVSYAYARHTFKGKKLLYAVAMIPMVVNVAGTQPALYKLLNNMGVYDNIFGILLLFTTGFGMNFLLLSSVFVNISGAYKEAAEIDGAGRWRIFLTIYLPQAGSLMSALFILSVINTWNDYTTPYLYLPSHQTLATGIYKLSREITIANSEFSDEYPKLFAAMIVSIAPILILFIAFQKKIMQFAVGGGIKG